MHVRDDGHAHSAADLVQGARVPLVRDGDAHDIAARIPQRENLSDASFHVARLGCRHTLDGDAAAAQQDIAHPHLTDHFAFSSWFLRSIICCNSAMKEEISLKERYTEA